MNKKILLITLTALAILGIWGFIIKVPVAAAKESGPSKSIISRVAEILGIDSTNLVNAFKQAKAEKVDQALQDGKITQKQADKIKEKINNSEFGGLKFGIRSELRNSLRNNIQDLANYLDMDIKDLLDQFASGKTIASIVEENGKGVEEVKIYLIEKANGKIDKAVTDGKITQEQADKIKENLNERIDNFLNKERPIAKQKDKMGQRSKEMK